MGLAAGIEPEPVHRIGIVTPVPSDASWGAKLSVSVLDPTANAPLRVLTAAKERMREQLEELDLELVPAK